MTRAPDRPVTLRDVADRAGVHPSTVSRILSGARGGDSEAAARVHKAAQELGYRINTVARSLRQQSTTTIGLVVPDLENPFFPSLVKSIESALNRAGYVLLLCDAQDDPVVEAQRVDALLQRQVDGLMISPVHLTKSVPTLRSASAKVPTVQVDRRLQVPTDFIGVDQDMVMTLVIEHLRSIGRTRFAFLTTDESVSTVADRLRTYRRLVSSELDGSTGILTGDLTVEWGIEAVGRLLEAGKPMPDALICANDLIALGALQRLRQAGLRVPDDIAITGIDDTAFGRVSEPELTSVRQPVDQLGDEAVAMLLGRLHRPKQTGRDLAARTLVLAPELLVRRSTVASTDRSRPARSRRNNLGVNL